MKTLKKYIILSWRGSFISLLVFAAAFAICFILQQFSENDFHVPLIFVLAVMIVSRMTDGYFYGFLASVVGVIAVNYIFTYPYYELDFTMTGYPLTFATMLLVSFVTSTMTVRIKNQEHSIIESEKEKIRANLLRGISHDIRTPLTGIVGSSNVLLENNDLPDNEKRELLQNINEDAQWLIHMVENVLSITRIGDDSACIEKEPEIVEEIIGEAVMKFKKRWPDIGFDISIPDSFLFVPMDAMLIEQVIQNILYNSAVHGECSMIRIKVSESLGKAVFRFCDNGRGFRWNSQENRPLLGGTGETGKADKHKNMGIGLSVCRTIIHAHQGEMDLYNSDEGGAVVEFRLPLENNDNGY